MQHLRQEKGNLGLTEAVAQISLGALAPVHTFEQCDAELIAVERFGASERMFALCQAARNRLSGGA